MSKEDLVVMFVLYLPVMSLSYFAFRLVAARVGLSYEPTNEE
jgi:hypothetical protein